MATTMRQTAGLDVEHGEHERFAHYVRRDEYVDSMVYGVPLTALCGKRWVPSRDPDRYPVCPECRARRG